MSAPDQPVAPTRSWMVAVATVPAVAIGVVLTAVLVVLVGLVGLLVGVGVTLALGAYAASKAAVDPTDRVLRDLGARPAEPAGEARLVNLVEGLSVGGGIAPPALHVLDDDALNLLVLGVDERSAHVVVTRGLLDALERIELEGVLARAVTQVRRGDLPAATTAVEVLSGHGAGGLLARPVSGVLEARLGRVTGPDDDVHLDRDAVGLTRYPPGLIGALRKLEAGTTVVSGPVGPTAALWLADPTGHPDPTRPTLAHRIEVLELL